MPMARDPASDNTAGIALMKQAVKLGATFSGAAVTHQTVAYAGHVGATHAGTVCSTTRPRRWRPC